MSGSSGVRVNIQADASAAIAAFDRMRAAIRATRQEGVAFRDIDLSHPERSCPTTWCRSASARA